MRVVGLVTSLLVGGAETARAFWPDPVWGSRSIKGSFCLRRGQDEGLDRNIATEPFAADRRSPISSVTAWVAQAGARRATTSGRCS